MTIEKKLKTLKDLDKKYDEQDNCGYTWNMESVYCELRQIAITWIKQLNESIISGDNRDMPEANRPFEHIEGWKGQVLAQINWIKHFFNIEEKDLEEVSKK